MKRVDTKIKCYLYCLREHFFKREPASYCSSFCLIILAATEHIAWIGRARVDECLN